jgi:hypothetical protein
MKDKDFGSGVLALSAPQIMNPLAFWYRGLEIVLPYFWENDMHDFVEGLWQTAVWRSDLNCLLIISQHLRHVTYEHWETLNQRNQDENFSEREDWKRIFQVVGEKLLTNEETKYGLPTKTPLLYHTLTLCVEGASCAWSLGHRKLEDRRHIESNTSLTGTALWINSIQGNLETAIWLFKHGADPAWLHPTVLTMPAHAIARRAFSFPLELPISAGDIYRDTIRTDLYHVLFEDCLLTRDLQDRCVCRCSRAGCRPISSAMSTFTRIRPLGRRVYDRRLRPLFSISDVFSVVRLATDQDWIASSILQVMTFEGLLLTHTCCHEACAIDFWGKIRFLSRSSLEEIEMIQEDEQTGLNRLEDLVAEFEADWDAYEGSFESFIWKVWRPRMQAVRRGNGDRNGHIADLAKIGVKLADSHDSDNGNDEMTWIEYFLFGKEKEEEGEEDGRHYWTL